MDHESFLQENKTVVIATLLILIVGTAYYFGAGLGTMRAGPSAGADAVFDGLRIKSVVSPEGELDLFVHARNNALARLTATEGEPIPESGTAVFGALDGAMMREEGVFSKMGDSFDELPGIDLTVGGLLAPTGTILDMLHFLSAAEYAAVEGEENVFVKRDPEGVPKVFFTLPEGANSSLELELAEGNLADYKTHEIVGVTYQPLLIGSSEAAMMREEKLFTAPGDEIKRFFGTNVIVVGVLAPTNTSLDMLHLTPLTAEELS